MDTTELNLDVSAEGARALVNAVDELPEGFDFDALPEEVMSILSYINTQSRHVVESASK
jgi:hypothetical protein